MSGHSRKWSALMAASVATFHGFAFVLVDGSWIYVSSLAAILTYQAGRLGWPDSEANR